jgi:hypothetical protein
MKKVIGILALAAAPVIFAQEKPAASLSSKAQQTEQANKATVQAEKERALQAQKEAEAKQAEAKKVEASKSATNNKAQAPQSLKQQNSREAQAKVSSK